jgi:cysteine desulfurase
MSMEAAIYLDYMASTPLDPTVRMVLDVALRDEFANPSSEGHILGWKARDAVERARCSIAESVGAMDDEIIFTSGATEADNLGILGAALGAPQSRRRILVGEGEHKAVLEAARALEALGYIVETVGLNSNGVTDVKDLAEKLRPDVAVVSLMAVNNETGIIQPIAEIASLAAAVGAFIHTDATQAPAAMKVDVAAWGVDAASFSSHKVYGPKGVGALYLSAAAPWRPRPLLHGGGQEQGLRPGTVPTALCLGFAAALKTLSENERTHIAALRDTLEARLRQIAPDMVVTGASVSRHPGALHVRFPGRNASELLDQLQPIVCAATGSACTSGMMDPSHVLLALGWDRQAANEGLRFSLGRFTTEDEIARTAQALTNVLSRSPHRSD